MNLRSVLPRPAVALLSGFFVLLFLGGCATNRVNWDSRVGSYSYDQSVLELGPPDRETKLTDGTRVAEWLTYRGYSRGGFSMFSGPYHPYSGGGWVHHQSEPPSPDHFLRLTFSPDGNLQSWRHVLK